MLRAVEYVGAVAAALWHRFTHRGEDPGPFQVVPNRADLRAAGVREGRYRMPRTQPRRTGRPAGWSR